MSSSPTILITGTTGFVGRNLKEYFQQRNVNVHCPNRATLNLLDSPAVKNYVQQGQFDVVIHCGVTLSSVEENLKMYFNLERCSDNFGKMICVGSGAEYDPRNYIPKIKENYFRANIPTDIYGFSKYVIANDIENRPRNIYNLRIFGIFGKYENYKRRFLSNNICRVLSGMDISINRDMNFDYLHVDDFARALEMFIGQNPRHRNYNFCTGEPISLLKLAHMIKAVHGTKVAITVKEDGFNPEYSGDPGLFMGEFGLFTFTKLEESIEKLYDWYQHTSGLAFSQSLFD